MKYSDGPVATLIGDVIDSRRVADRRSLHAVLSSALDASDAPSEAVSPLRLTVGDEFQGTFKTVGEALAVTLSMRLRLLPTYDVRFGIGYGPVSVLSAEPRVEDGPAWWAARDAIGQVERLERKASRRLTRSAYRRAVGSDGPDEAAINAALLSRDQLVGVLDERSLGLLRGLLAGRSQRQLADEQGVSPSAVSQRVRNDGLDVIVAVDDLLGGVR